MTCEICNRNKAETVLRRDGEKELYVCRQCARAAKAAKTKKDGKTEGSPDRTTVTVIGPMDSNGKPPPIVEAFVKATLGLIKDLSEVERQEKSAKEPEACPKCGAKWSDIEKSGLVGCPECYKAFRRSVREKFTPMQYGPKHVGSMPEGISGEDSREFLKREIASAVKREDFKKAAELKRKLDGIVGGTP